jgi:hypothetical protein
MKKFISILIVIFCFSCNSFEERQAHLLYAAEHGEINDVELSLLTGMDVNTVILVKQL